MSCRRLPQYHSDRGWILGVALTGTLTLIRSALRGFTRVRCCSTPPASSPRALTGSRSCSWLTVASNRPCRGLAPPIGHSCSTYPVALRAPCGAPEAGSLSLLTDTSMCDFSPIFTTIRCPRKPYGAGYFVQFLRRGTVSMATPTPDGQHPIYIEVSASFGASGSPVFTQDSRNAIGIVSSTLLLPGGLPLPAGVLEVIPGERINKFLHDGGVHGY